MNQPFSLDVVVFVMLTNWDSFTITTSECHLMQSEGDLSLITARPSESLRVTNLSDQMALRVNNLNDQMALRVTNLRDQMADSPCKPLRPVLIHWSLTTFQGHVLLSKTRLFLRKWLRRNRKFAHYSQPSLGPNIRLWLSIEQLFISSSVTLPT